MMCIRWLEAGRPRREIADKLGMSSKTISAIKRGETSPRRPGRRSVLTDEHLSFIETNTLADATLSDGRMAEMIQQRFNISVSRSTITRVRNELGFHYRPPRVKQELTEIQKKERVEFCHWALSNRDKIPCIVFSDESRFQLGPDNCWRRIRRGEHNESSFVSRVKFNTGVMIWGAIALDYRSELVRCSGGVGAEEYTRILEKSGLVSSLNDKFGNGLWTFMQDGAPCHTARATTSWLNSNKVCVLPVWPANSPDLNPIEMIWGIMKRKVKWKDTVRNGDEMFAELQRVWKEIEKETINKLVLSFYDRCQIVLHMGGESASAHLRARRPVPIGPLPEIVTDWSDDEDKRLLELYAAHGDRWQQIASHLGRDPRMVKKRFKMLDQIEKNGLYRAYVRLPPIDELLETI